MKSPKSPVSSGSMVGNLAVVDDAVADPSRVMIFALFHGEVTAGQLAGLA
jgi:hypothetical protein